MGGSSSAGRLRGCPGAVSRSAWPASSPAADQTVSPSGRCPTTDRRVPHRPAVPALPVATSSRPSSGRTRPSVERSRSGSRGPVWPSSRRSRPGTLGSSATTRSRGDWVRRSWHSAGTRYALWTALGSAYAPPVPTGGAEHRAFLEQVITTVRLMGQESFMAAYLGYLAQLHAAVGEVPRGLELVGEALGGGETGEYPPARAAPPASVLLAAGEDPTGRSPT